MSLLRQVIGVFVVAYAAGAAEPGITVQVYNPARVHKPELRKGLTEAGWILRNAGIEAHWLDCGDPVGHAADSLGCQSRTKFGVFAVLSFPKILAVLRPRMLWVSPSSPDKATVLRSSTHKSLPNSRIIPSTPTAISSVM